MSVVDAAFQIHALFGVMLVAHHFGMHAGEIEVGGKVLTASRDDHLSFSRLAQQGLHNWFHGEQFKIDAWIQFVQDYGFVETA